MSYSNYQKKISNSLFYKAVGAPPGSGFVGKLSKVVRNTNKRRVKVVPRRNAPRRAAPNTVVLPMTRGLSHYY